MREWQSAVNAYFKGRFSTALYHVEAADKILADLSDVNQLRSILQKLIQEHPSWDTERRTVSGTLLAVSLAALATIFSVAFGVRAVRRRKKIPKPT